MAQEPITVAVVAHNEGALIEGCLRDVLAQRTSRPLKVYVVANGCTDDTAQVVARLAAEQPRVELIDLPEKGKARAVNVFVKLLCAMHDKQAEGQCAVFMDADVTFVEPDALERLAERIESDPALFAVAARCIPESMFNRNRDFVSQLYRARYLMQEAMQFNVLRGMCYIARLSVMRDHPFPEDILGEDTYLAALLEGHYVMDRQASIRYSIHRTFRGELRRNLRHVLCKVQQEDLYRRKLLGPIDRHGKTDYSVSRWRSKPELVRALLRIPPRYWPVLAVFTLMNKINLRRALAIFERAREQGISLYEFWTTCRA